MKKRNPTLLWGMYARLKSDRVPIALLICSIYLSLPLRTLMELNRKGLNGFGFGNRWNMEAWGYDIKEIGHEDVSELVNLDIVALQIAEAGAMGYHGGVFMVTKKSEIYFTCLLKPSSYTGFAKTMSRSDLEKIFPPLADFQHGLLGKGLLVPNGWRHEYLGVGNHLLVKDEYWKRFTKEADRIEKQNPQVILYSMWLQAILAAI